MRRRGIVHVVAPRVRGLPLQSMREAARQLCGQAVILGRTPGHERRDVRTREAAGLPCRANIGPGLYLGQGERQ